jgi:carboxyl-terminal processing protease
MRIWEICTLIASSAIKSKYGGNASKCYFGTLNKQYTRGLGDYRTPAFLSCRECLFCSYLNLRDPNMPKPITTVLLVFIWIKTFGQTPFQNDFDYYWKTINDKYAYFDKQKTNWQKVKTTYQPWVDSCKTKGGFVHLLEVVNNELYNGHSFLNTNTSSSNRTIPTGADLKVIYENGSFIIDEVRQGFNADLCGLKKGMPVLYFNGQPMEKAIRLFLPRAVATYDNEMYEYAANMLLAGAHHTQRKITARVAGKPKDFFPDHIPNKTESNDATLLEWKKLGKNIGYIRIHNSLGDVSLIKEFDQVLDSLINTDGLILDLRETPSGGNTTVARAIMGRFITREMPYQKHIYISEEKETGIKRSTLELVSPRLQAYSKPMVVLAGYWTGSMGEGITIGFDAMKRAKIVGSKMAGLLGEIYSFETPELKIPFSFPCVQLQTVSGQPREDYMPTIQVKDQKESIDIAMKLLTPKK